MSSTPTTFVFPPVTGQIVKRLGISTSLYTIEASQSAAFPTTTAHDREWDDHITGDHFTGDPHSLAVGDVVVFAWEGTRGKKGAGLKLGRVCHQEAEGQADEPPAKRRKTSLSATTGQSTVRVEKLGRLRDVLGQVARRNELYITGEKIDVPVASITTKVTPLSYRLRLAHDERHTSWESAENAAPGAKEEGDFFTSKSQTWMHNGIEIHQSDVLRLQATIAKPGQAERENILVQVTELQERGNEGLKVQMAKLGVTYHNSSSEQAIPEVIIEKGKPFRFDQTHWKVIAKIVVLPASSTAVDGQIAHLLPGRQQLLRARNPSTVTAFQTCSRCEESVRKSAEKAQVLLKGGLKALCLFSGAGGEVAGFRMDGFVEAICAIDADPLCGLTTKTIDPNITCLAEDISLMVKNIIRGQPLPAGLPNPGDVQVLTLSPPCQGFSKANHRRAGHDPRNMLVAVSLAMVELYMPCYAVLENVLGMLEPGMKMGNESQGAVKLIIATLIELGYSVKMSIVEATSFGSPSIRRRVLFLASRNRPLPHLPPPTHISSRPTAPTITLSPRAGVSLQYKSSGSHAETVSMSPLRPARSVRDATSDLPHWDWRDPHSLYGEFSRMDDLKRHRRQDQGITTYQTTLAGDETSTWRRGAVGPSAASYSRSPQNSFQDLMRHGSSPGNPILQHQTYRPSALTAERATNIPFHPGASCRDLGSPLVNKPLLANDNRKEDWRLAANRDVERHRELRSQEMERMDDGVPCDTLLTAICLDGKMGASMHPHDARVVSVREMARLQGFPDCVVFGGPQYGSEEGMNAQKAYKQIGNALPPLVVRAVGRAIAASHVEWGSSKDKAKAR